MPPQTPRRSIDPAVSKLAGPAAWGGVVTPIADDPRPRRTHRNREVYGYTAIAAVACVVFTVYQFCNIDGGLYRGTPVHTVLASLDAAVPFFFVLIGFRAFRPMVVAYLDQARIITPRRFPARQAVAIVPAYYAVITVAWFCRQQSLPGDWRDLLEHLTFTQVFDSKRIFYTDGPAWAVSVTVVFLVLITMVDVGLTRFPLPSTRTRRLIVLAAPTAALTAMSVAWKAWSLAGAHRPTAGSSTTWYGPLANLDNFALGMAAALILAALEQTPVRPAHRAALRGGAMVMVVVAVATRYDSGWFAAYFTTICAVGFAILLTAATLAADVAPRRSNPRLSWVSGLVAVAYGTYLWREPVLLALNGWDGVVVQKPGAFIQDTLVVLAVSLLIGAMSYLAIEQPALQLYRLATAPRRHDNPPPTPLAPIHPISTARPTKVAHLGPGPADARSSPAHPSQDCQS